MTRVSDYDLFDYDYSSYWKARIYEDKAEKHIFNKLFRNKRGNWFLDIGGSYGRLASTYYSNYTSPVILDYSLKTLQRNYTVLKKKYPKIVLVAANAYHMPFKEGSFDGAIMVRVLHHILEPQTYLKELNRIMASRATYIQEFANKVNIKAVFRAITHLDMGLLSKEPYQQPTGKNFEGTKTGEQTIFVNFHPQYIKENLEMNDFEIQSKHGCSYLRSPKLKKLFGNDFLLRIEYLLQTLFAFTNFPPSVIFETTTRKAPTEKVKSKKLEDILVCPQCHGILSFTKDKAVCQGCKKEYTKKENIWDFRID